MLPGLERSGRSSAVFHASVIRASCGLPFQTKRRGNNASVTDKDAETAKIVQKTKRQRKECGKTNILFLYLTCLYLKLYSDFSSPSSAAPCWHFCIVFWSSPESGLVNPFIAPACKISGLKDADSIFSGPITSAFDAMRFDENPFTCQREKEDRNT